MREMGSGCVKNGNEEGSEEDSIVIYIHFHDEHFLSKPCWDGECFVIYIRICTVEGLHIFGGIPFQYNQLVMNL